MNRYKKTLLFIIITFSLSWLAIFAFIRGGGQWHTTNSMLIASLYMFIPFFSSVIVCRLFKISIKEGIGLNLKWSKTIVLAWLLPFAIALLSIAISLLMPGTFFTLGMEGLFERYGKIITPEQLEAMKKQLEVLPVHPVLISTIQAAFAGITLNALLGFGEESGWRGFLQRELKHLGFLNSSLVIGIIWGVWHAPLIMMGHNYPDHPHSGVFLMVIFCMLFSPILAYVRQKSGTILAPAIMHGTFNATAGLPLMVLAGGSDLTTGSLGAAGIIAMGLATLLLTRKMKVDDMVVPHDQ